jgi:hypothetical protein
VPPQQSKNSGGPFARAASGLTRDAARLEGPHIIVRSLAILSCTVAVLVFSAADLWPHLFAR